LITGQLYISPGVINGRIGNLLRWRVEAYPDLVCLQELKTKDHKFTERALTDAGYHAIRHGQKSRNGIAILSRFG
jgi:exodeoxyribonuclease-3